MENTVYGLFQKVAKDGANNRAIIENDRTLTFAELSELVDAISTIIPEGSKTVGIVMSHRAEMVASMLAALKVGARYVPAEPSFPAARIRFMMKESEADIVLTETPYAAMLEGYDSVLLDCELCGKDASSSPREPCACPSDAAYVLYTSGSTGRPKGISVTNANVCHYVRAFAHEFHPAPGDVMLQHSVCTFDIFVEEVFASLLNGAAIAIPPKGEREDIVALMGFAERHHVTMLSGFSYLLAEMNRLPSIPQTLRLLISGGDVLRSCHVDNLVGQVQVYNTYGPSETTVCATYFRCDGAPPLPDGTYPIGRAVQGVDVRVLRPDGTEAAVGEAGEIWIAGAGVSQGYIGDRTEEMLAFVKRGDGSVVYRSGDAGYRQTNGDIVFLYRIDSQVMVGGQRVELAEVEHALYGCDGVDQAVVRSCEGPEGASYLIAYMVLDEERALGAAEIRAQLSRNLAGFMVPEFFVRMPAIPLNVNGKPDTLKLPVVMKEGIL